MLPVVSAAVPDYVVVHGVNGLRIDAMDPARYADALEELFRDWGLWARLSKGGREFAERLDYVEIARRYAEILAAL